MKQEEPRKRELRKTSAHGLMTRGKYHKLQEKVPPKVVQPEGMDEESFTAKIKETINQGDSEKYANMTGTWFPQQMWPPGQVMGLPDGQKMIPKQPNFFIPPLHPQLAHQIHPQMGHMGPQIQHPQMYPGPMGHPMPNMGPMPMQHHNQMTQKVGNQIPIQQINPKMPPMGQMVMPGMRGVQFSPKSSQPGPQIMPKNIPTMQNMPPLPQMGGIGGMSTMPGMQNMFNMNNSMYAPMYPRIGPKSPSYIKNQVIRNRYSKPPAPSPKNMDAFLSETLEPDEKTDWKVVLREEITKMLKSELTRFNDLHDVSDIFPGSNLGDKTYFTSKQDKTDNKKDKKNDKDKKDETDKPFNYVDLEKIVDVLIDKFKPVMEEMWKESKRYHQYALDQFYYLLTQGSNTLNITNQGNIQIMAPYRNKSNNEEENFKKEWSIEEELESKDKNSDGSELVVLRDLTGLKSLFQKRDEIEKLLTSYRTISRSSFGNSYFTFSNFTPGPIPSETVPNLSNDKREDEFLKQAIEYADVASNQKLLVNNVTALDLRSALSGDNMQNYLPNPYRSGLLETVNLIHFDLGTPPQSPKFSKREPEQDTVLNKVYETLQSFQNAEANTIKPPSNNISFAKFMASYTPYSREDRLKELLSSQGPINKGFNLQPTMKMYPNLPTNMGLLHPSMNTIPTSMANSGGNIPGMGPNIGNFPPPMSSMQMNMDQIPNMPPNMNGIPGNMNSMGGNMNSMGGNMNSMSSNMNSMSGNMNGMGGSMGNIPVHQGHPQNFNIPSGGVPQQMQMPMPNVPPHIQAGNNQFYNK
ncbi:hypothetical protein TpMuguga_01g00098 [Theileria parva strain Muguga]|uniref:Uncharacterized protein n=1 Tax=Theileria parva TaxID=5875 RepID=Q4N9L6_THEPA|nr:uncharacterized protein TpMuguga_01g00098 [Theileria parva strain Muguga]EAN33342.1 hypothetical protein TpMuguga_01g00098 [Theileria parva strain Muguga]|eukprot:XP_765625.1 hypothetical protein [Theileria parva strain Muguga]